MCECVCVCVCVLIISFRHPIIHKKLLNLRPIVRLLIYCLSSVCNSAWAAQSAALWCGTLFASLPSAPSSLPEPSSVKSRTRAHTKTNHSNQRPLLVAGCSIVDKVDVNRR